MQVYSVLKRLHLWEKHEGIQEMIERVVNMLMRDEAESHNVPAIQELVEE